MSSRPRRASSGFALVLVLASLACAEPAKTADQAEKAEKAEKAGEAEKADGAADPGEGVSVSRPEGERLTLGAAKIMRTGHEDRAIVIGADGVVVLAGTPFGTVRADGSLSTPEGQPMMTVEADNTVTAGDGPTGMVLEETGGTLTLDKLNVEVRIGADGKIVTTVSGQNAALLGVDAPQLVSEGCTGLVTKTCALITLSYLMALGNPDSVQDADAPAPAN